MSVFESNYKEGIEMLEAEQRRLWNMIQDKSERLQVIKVDEVNLQVEIEDTRKQINKLDRSVIHIGNAIRKLKESDNG